MNKNKSVNFVLPASDAKKSALVFCHEIRTSKEKKKKSYFIDRNVTGQSSIVTPIYILSQSISWICCAIIDLATVSKARYINCMCSTADKHK